VKAGNFLKIGIAKFVKENAFNDDAQPTKHRHWNLSLLDGKTVAECPGWTYMHTHRGTDRHKT